MGLFSALKPKRKNYISETTHFLNRLKSRFPGYSTSQKKEIQKHHNIFNRVSKNKSNLF